MSTPVLLNLLSKLRKTGKMLGCGAFYYLFATSLRNFINTRARISYSNYIRYLDYFEISFLA